MLIILVINCFLLTTLAKDLIKIKGNNYILNSCPCGLPKHEFDKAFRKNLLIKKKDSILSKLPKTKRSPIEINYTITLEKFKKFSEENPSIFLEEEAAKAISDINQPYDLLGSGEGLGDTTNMISSMSSIDTMKMTLFDKNLDKKHQAPWHLLLKSESGGSHQCDGAFVNRRFILASKPCVQKITDLIIVKSTQCSSEEWWRPSEVTFFGDSVALIDVGIAQATLKNFPICLPSPKNWFKEPSSLDATILSWSFGRVFSMSNCSLHDFFVQLVKNQTTALGVCDNYATSFCTWSPDLIMESWLPQASLLTKSDANEAVLYGVADNWQKSENKKNYYQFSAINQLDIMTWLTEKIQSGECPNYVA